MATVPVKPNTLPDIYTKLGAYTGFHTRPADHLRIFLAAESGMGKTTFAASIPNSLILDFEQGADFVTSNTNFRIGIQDMEHYTKIKEQLLRDGEQKKRPVSRIIFDTVDEMVAFYAADITREKGIEAIEEYGQKGAGWSLLRRRVIHDLDSFWMAGYSWMVLGHLQETVKTNPHTKRDETVLRTVLSPKMGAAIMRKVDYLLTIVRYAEDKTEMKTSQLKDGRTITQPIHTRRIVHKLMASQTPELPGKARLKLTPLELELPQKGGWELFKTAYETSAKVAGDV